jgi:hypothetical protein
MAWILLVGVIAIGCSAGGTNEVKPANWPDLSTLDNYPNPFGNTCYEDGTTERGGMPRGDKATENDLKNRFYLPATFQPYSVDQMLRLPNNSDDALEHTGVTLTGYVEDVKPGGSSGESCNCEATGTNLVDAHIEVINDPKEKESEGRGMVIVEVTERSRRLANLGLLSSNIGKDWSTEQLRHLLTGKWVQFSGWLLYDSDHVKESWSVDPEDDLGRRNRRGTPWEVHPAMGIEVLAGGSPSKP